MQGEQLGAVCGLKTTPKAQLSRFVSRELSGGALAKAGLFCTLWMGLGGTSMLLWGVM